jgi:hypothetical protein
MLCDHSTPYNSHLFVLPQRLRRLYPTDEKAVPVDACLRCYRHVTAYAGIVHAQQHLNLMQARLRSTSCQVTTCCQLSKEETIRSTEALDGTLEHAARIIAIVRRDLWPVSISPVLRYYIDAHTYHVPASKQVRKLAERLA